MFDFFFGLVLGLGIGAYNADKGLRACFDDTLHLSKQKAIEAKAKTGPALQNMKNQASPYVKQLSEKASSKAAELSRKASPYVQQISARVSPQSRAA